MADEAQNHWIVGSAFKGGSEEQLDRFLQEGVWEIQDPKPKDRQLVLSMRAGDPIAVKSTFTRKHDLPFENNGESVSVLRLKARGVIRENSGEGDRVTVDWDEDFVPKEWYFYTYLPTIWRLDTEKEMARRLISFAFHDHGQDFDWFLGRPAWRERYSGEATEHPHQAIWIEKTIVKGRPDRNEGDHRLGSALWSPQKSKSGGDIYSNMRAVKPGDIVLHLTDNESFSGVSIASDRADESFDGVANTDWAGSCYRIPLTQFTKLDPPLQRDDLLRKQPFADELAELIESGTKGLFFNSKLELNQGAYLTEATPTLVAILSRAYEDVAGKSLPLISQTELAEPDVDIGPEPYSLDDALVSVFFEQDEVEAILRLWKAKKNVVLQGPPGVGKSFAAEKLAFALMGEAERDRVGFVQFHQSYSYEDFVEGFRPTEKGFELKAGKFVQFCRKAEADPTNRYVFVIDEINRGNLSKILGELMLLVEGDKRGPSWAMPLASGKVAFHVPPNVYLMGLMNTADRSLAVVDYALRRRFGFVDVQSKIGSPKFAEHLTDNDVSPSMIEKIGEKIGDLNEEILSDTLNLGPGFVIGHSYFCSKPLDDEDESEWYKRIIQTEIAPLLREYWFDDPSKASEWEARLG